MTTPTSTSVGASTPSAIRATPTSATSPAATHLPALRQRPSGTSVYSAPADHGAHGLDRGRWHREASPAKKDRHAEGQRPVHDKQDERRQEGEYFVADDQHQQMPEPARRNQRQQERVSSDDRRRCRARLSDHPGGQR